MKKTDHDLFSRCFWNSKSKLFFKIGVHAKSKFTKARYWKILLKINLDFAIQKILKWNRDLVFFQDRAVKVNVPNRPILKKSKIKICVKIFGKSKSRFLSRFLGNQNQDFVQNSNQDPQSKCLSNLRDQLSKQFKIVSRSVCKNLESWSWFFSWNKSWSRFFSRFGG